MVASTLVVSVSSGKSPGVASGTSSELGVLAPISFSPDPSRSEQPLPRRAKVVARNKMVKNLDGRNSFTMCSPTVYVHLDLGGPLWVLL